MSQHDMNIANADGATFRADLNSALQAMIENSSGATSPSTTFVFQWWADTSTDTMKIRNAANSAWITVFTLSSGGILKLGGALDTNAFAINESEGAIITDSGTPDIFNATDGNTMHLEGTTTITDFPDAPAIGIWRKIIFDGIRTLTHGSGITLPSGANITTAVGDYAFVYADAVNAFTVLYFKADGTAIVNNLNGQIEVTDVTITGSAATTPDANTLTKDHLIGARCTFNGTGTPAYIEEINFSGSITDGGTGVWTLTIDRDFVANTYTPLVSCDQSATDARIINFGTLNVGSLVIRIESFGGTPVDVASIAVALIGSQ